jgi:hypothetical protein
MHTTFQHTTLHIIGSLHYISHWMENSVQLKDFKESQIQFIYVIPRGFKFFPKTTSTKLKLIIFQNKIHAKWN